MCKNTCSRISASAPFFLASGSIYLVFENSQIFKLLQHLQWLVNPFTAYGHSLGLLDGVVKRLTRGFSYICTMDTTSSTYNKIVSLFTESKSIAWRGGGALHKGTVSLS